MKFVVTLVEKKDYVFEAKSLEDAKRKMEDDPVDIFDNGKMDEASYNWNFQNLKKLL